MPPSFALPSPGFSRADLHVHSTFSDGTCTPEDLLSHYAGQAGTRVFAITDHDTIDGARRARRLAAERPEIFGHLEVIVGEEITTRDGHVIGLFLEDRIPPGMSAARTVDAIHAQGGLAIAAHPYTSWLRWTGLVGVGDLIHDLPFDAVETRNANFSEVFANRRAAANCRGPAHVGSSDAHFVDAIGWCFTEFPGETALDLRRAIETRSTVARGRCYGAATLARYALRRLRCAVAVMPGRRRAATARPAPAAARPMGEVA